MRILAIGAHPDDIEIACSGTLAKCIKRGDTVIVCHVSSGSLGHVVIQPDELRLIRANEAKRAGALAGVEEVLCAGFDDLEIFDTKEARDKLVDIIKYANPDLIITHDPNDYMPDHVAVSNLVFDAAFTASCPHYETKVKGKARLTLAYHIALGSLDRGRGGRGRFLAAFLCAAGCRAQYHCRKQYGSNNQCKPSSSQKISHVVSPYVFAGCLYDFVGR